MRAQFRSLWNYYELYASIFIPSITTLLRYLKVFTFTIAELADSEKVQALKNWSSELVQALTAARADEKFCTKLLCNQFKCSQSKEIGELLATTLSQYIKKQQSVDLVFDIPIFVTSPVPQLKLFMKEVQLHHKGKLWLELQHSYFNYVACDDVIKVLAGARWDIWLTLY